MALFKSIELAPNWFEPYRLLSDIYLKEGKLEAALAKIEEAYRHDPNLPVMMRRAILHEQQGQYEKAMKSYEEILQKHGNAPAVLNNLAYLYAERKTDPADLEKASKMAAQAIAQQPDNPSFQDTAAWVAFKQGKLDVAWYHLQNSLALAPDNAVYNLHAAMVAQARSEKEPAMQYLEKAIQQEADPASRQKALALKAEWGL